MWEGVCSTIVRGDPDGFKVLLRYARLIKDPAGKLYAKDEIAEKPVENKIFLSQEIMQLFVRDVKMNPEDVGPEDKNDMGFGTDAAISRGRGG